MHCLWSLGVRSWKFTTQDGECRGLQADWLEESSALGKAAGKESAAGGVCGTQEETMVACVLCAIKTCWMLSRHDLTEPSDRPIREKFCSPQVRRSLVEACTVGKHMGS